MTHEPTQVIAFFINADEKRYSKAVDFFIEQTVRKEPLETIVGSNACVRMTRGVIT